MLSCGKNKKIKVNVLDDARRNVKQHVKSYQKYKDMIRLIKQTNEDTDRYNGVIRWYNAIRYVLNEWLEFCPWEAEIISETFALGQIKTPITVNASAMKHHVSTTTVYDMQKQFIGDVMAYAGSKNLLKFE